MAPGSTIKYLVASALIQTAMTVAHMGELGHRGDVQLLDDREHGFPRFIGTTRWEPAPFAADLGQAWLVPIEQTYKPYPHCRILHAVLDCLVQIVADNDTAPHEIDAIKVLVEGFVEQPVSDEELVAKFSHNADGVIAARAIDHAVNAVMKLESVADIGTVMGWMRTSTAP